MAKRRKIADERLAVLREANANLDDDDDGILERIFNSLTGLCVCMNECMIVCIYVCTYIMCILSPFMTQMRYVQRHVHLNVSMASCCQLRVI